MGRRGHVVPVNDRQPHEAGMKCWCHPLHLHGGTVVHNAADCRERIERHDGKEYAEGRWTLVYQESP
jgi:hypothetical protein